MKLFKQSNSLCKNLYLIWQMSAVAKHSYPVEHCYMYCDNKYEYALIKSNNLQRFNYKDRHTQETSLRKITPLCVFNGFIPRKNPKVMFLHNDEDNPLSFNASEMSPDSNTSLVL